MNGRLTPRQQREHAAIITACRHGQNMGMYYHYPLADAGVLIQTQHCLDCGSAELWRRKP